MSEVRSFEREYAEAYLLLLQIWIWSECAIMDGGYGLPANLRKKAIKVLGEDVVSGDAFCPTPPAPQE